MIHTPTELIITDYAACTRSVRCACGEDIVFTEEELVDTSEITLLIMSRFLAHAVDAQSDLVR